MEAETGWGTQRLLIINWPKPCVIVIGNNACFRTDSINYWLGEGEIRIPDGFEQNQDVILHEYGHFVLSRFNGDARVILACQPPSHEIWEEHSVTCAWSEGWANFFQMAVVAVPNDLDPDHNNFSLEDVEDKLSEITGDPEKYEGIVAATLWDIFDDLPESHDVFSDNFNGSFGTGIWYFSTTPLFSQSLPPFRLYDFWNNWANTRIFDACYGSVILQHHLLDYDPHVYTLTTSSNPSVGGSVVKYPAPNCPGSTYAEGTNVTLTANPNSGYAFNRWGGDLVSLFNPVNVIINTNKNITAQFKAATATPTSAGPTPTATPTGNAPPTPTKTPRGTNTPTFTPSPFTCPLIASNECTPTPTLTHTPTKTPTPTAPTPTPTQPPAPQLWAEGPLAISPLIYPDQANSNVTILSGDSFHAEIAGGGFWMGGGVMATAREVPVGIIFYWDGHENYPGKRMCQEPFGPPYNLDATPCAWTNTSDTLADGWYCSAIAAGPYTAEQICQQMLGQNDLPSAWNWFSGTTRGLGWEQRATGVEFTVSGIQLIYYSLPPDPTATPTPSCHPNCPTPDAPATALPTPTPTP